MSLAQSLLSYQVMERWLTRDATQFELKLMDVAIGVDYCEDHGQSDGCFATGQALHYASSTAPRRTAEEHDYPVGGRHRRGGCCVQNLGDCDLCPILCDT